VPRGANRRGLRLHSPSIRPRPRRRQRESQSLGLFFSRPSPPSSLSRVRAAVHRSLKLAKVSGGDIRARGNWPHVKQPAICNPGGLILRGNDNSGTTRPPTAPSSPSLALSDKAHRGCPCAISSIPLPLNETLALRDGDGVARAILNDSNHA